MAFRVWNDLLGTLSNALGPAYWKELCHITCAAYYWSSSLCCGCHGFLPYLYWISLLDRRWWITSWHQIATTLNEREFERKNTIPPELIFLSSSRARWWSKIFFSLVKTALLGILYLRLVRLEVARRFLFIILALFPASFCSAQKHVCEASTIRRSSNMCRLRVSLSPSGKSTSGAGSSKVVAPSGIALVWSSIKIDSLISVRQSIIEWANSEDWSFATS